jgi:hypothetical protein
MSLVRRSFTKTPRGSNSTETRLSEVNLRTDKRFLMMAGASRTSLRRNGPGMVEYLVPSTERVAPFPTTMEEGKEEEGEEVIILGLEVMWEEAPESMTHSEEGDGAVSEMVLNALARECESHGDGAWGGAW